MSKFKGLFDKEKAELVDKFLEQIEYTNGVGVEKEKGSAVKAILTPEEHKTLIDGLEVQHKVEDIHQRATTLGAARQFLDNKDLEKVSTKVALGRGTLQSTFSPKRVHNNSFAKEGEPSTVTKYLVGNHKITGGIHRGMKAWRKEFSDAFQKEYE